VTKTLHAIARAAGLARVTNHNVARLHYLLTGRPLSSLATDRDRERHYRAAIRRARRAGTLKATLAQVSR